MKAAATLNINNGNPHENKLQGSGREKKEKGSVPWIHCMPERALETKLSRVLSESERFVIQK